MSEESHGKSHGGDATNTATAADLHSAGQSPSKSKGGAPIGNTNGSPDPEWALRQRELKAAKARGRARGLKAWRQRTQTILAQRGLLDDALASLIADDLAWIGVELDTLSDSVQRRGRFRARDGQPTAWYQLSVDLRGDRLTRCEKLLDRLEARATPGTEIVHRVVIIEDVDAPDGNGTITAADLAAWQARSAAPGSALGRRADEWTLSAKLANGEATLPDEAFLDSIQDPDSEDPDDRPQAARVSQPSPEASRRVSSTSAAKPKAPGAASAPGNVEPTAPQTLLEQFSEADRRAREFFDRGGSFGGLGRLF